MKEVLGIVEIKSDKAEHTYAIGYAIGKKAKPGDVFALTGELGAGKTCFAGGLARGLDVGEDYAITSPTFTLLNEYPGRHRFFHFDVYRLDRIVELDDLGYDEYVSGKGVVLVEWAEKITDALPIDTVWICIEYIGENERKICIRGPKQRVQDLVSDIKTEV